MAKFVGVKNTYIVISSEQEIQNKNMEILQLPEELQNINNNDLMLYCRYIDGKFIYTNKHSKKEVKDLKVAFVSNHLMACGISEYGHFLFPEIIKHVKEYRLFAERNESKIGQTNLDEKNIDWCWNRGEPLIELAEKIKAYNPDVVFINHEFGIFPNARYWLALMNQLEKFRVITIMHSVYPQHMDKTICEAVMEEIIVHLPEAKDTLENIKKINAKVYMIFHGCFKPDENKQKKLWNVYKSEHTFMQFGFLFPYKNFQYSIKACAVLKEKYKYEDVFFTGICSESQFAKNEHQIYYNQLQDLILDLHLENNVSLIRGYQANEVIDTYLRTNVAAVFPYLENKDHICYGASGAGPYSFNLGLPVISSTMPHFKHLPSIKAETPENIAGELDKLFKNDDYIKRQVEKQNEYLMENCWEKTGLKIVEILK